MRWLFPDVVCTFPEVGKKLRPILWVALALLFTLPASAQWGDSTKTDTTARPAPGKPKLQTTSMPDSTQHRATLLNDYTIDFPNLNKMPLFEDRHMLAQIKKAEKKKDFKKLMALLEKYVSNFGVLNFEKDNRLLWRLAQLHERIGDKERANMLYALVLKHHRTDIKQILQYYDSLSSAGTEVFVPLSYYYELLEYRKSVSYFKPPKGINIKLGSELNSKYEDYGPALNDAGKLFLFSSQRKFRKMEGLPDEDLYYSKMVDGYWDEAKPLPKPINSIYNEGSACLSQDGKTLYFARCLCPACKGNCDLYSAALINDSTWGRVRSLGPQVNSSGWDSQPSLSPGGDTLYFASDRLGGFGLSDIWFTVKQKNGAWGPAQNLGPVVNTRDNEVSPFYHPKYHVLYFSSNGQLVNMGDHDLFKAYRVNGRWQEPRNLGPLVNGAGKEYYFTIDNNSENLYYARSEQEDLKNLDLYSFPVPMEAHPLAVTKFSGILTDSLTNKPLRGIVSVIDLTNGVEVASKYIKEDGSFDFDLIDNSKYRLIIQSPDFFSVEQEIDLRQDTVMKMMTTMIDYSIPLVFQNIEFDEGLSNIKETMHPILDRIVFFLLDHPTFKLHIGGHTDSDGDEQFNLELSQARADAIKEYLSTKGKLSKSRIEALGYGSMQPLRTEETEEDKRINRRVEFKVIRPEK